jgi:hypothetical protein
MFRKTLIAAAAVATIAAAALVQTTASAKSFKYGGWGPYWGYGFGFAIAAPMVYSCVRYVERYGVIYKVYVC